MRADKLAEHFDPQLGRPTKELNSMVGLLFITEFRNWTHEEAADAYMFNIEAQYMLNLQHSMVLLRIELESLSAIHSTTDMTANRK